MKRTAVAVLALAVMITTLVLIGSSSASVPPAEPITSPLALLYAMLRLLAQFRDAFPLI